ncbi:MAG TPA: tripartite tricarboxylate transporter substrate-binding protein [bacterium]|jgi:putative tricarboxylic transport membrane protein
MTFPAKAVTFIAAASPGGGWHVTCEAAVAALREERLLPVDVEMVTTPGGLKVLEETVTGRRGDGHTLVAFSPGLTLQMLLKGSRYSYDDITPIAALSTDYGALVVPSASPIKSLDDLVAHLRASPQDLPVTGGSGPGAMHHGMMGVVAHAAGLAPADVRYVGAEGVGPAVQGLREGRAPLGALGAADVLEDVKTGAVRILAVLSGERIAGALEDVPTAIEQGLNVTFPMWRGFYAGPGVEPAAVAFWADTFSRLHGTSTWQTLLAEKNWFPFLLTGERFRAFLQEDTERYAQVLGRTEATGAA